MHVCRDTVVRSAVTEQATPSVGALTPPVAAAQAFNYKFTTGRYDFKNREAEQDNLLKLLRRCLRTSFSKKDALVKSLGSLADQAQQQLEGARLSQASAEAARDAALVSRTLPSVRGEPDHFKSHFMVR